MFSIFVVSLVCFKEYKEPGAKKKKTIALQHSNAPGAQMNQYSINPERMTIFRAPQ